uniref:Uncharacterized protein n=1 Tax=Sphaerodactylus townsendi TaxID=933632 RepID=A0ACB8FQY7_9SAUR
MLAQSTRLDPVDLFSKWGHLPSSERASQWKAFCAPEKHFHMQNLSIECNPTILMPIVCQEDPVTCGVPCYRIEQYCQAHLTMFKVLTHMFSDVILCMALS